MNASTGHQGLYVVLVEDHALLRDVLKEYIGILPGVTKCETVANAESVLEGFHDNVPDLVLIDLSLPGMNGIELVRELRNAHPLMPLAILSGHQLSYARDALEAGANGYLVKGDIQEIERGMAAIFAGDIYVSGGLGADP